MNARLGGVAPLGIAPWSTSSTPVDQPLDERWIRVIRMAMCDQHSGNIADGVEVGFAALERVKTGVEERDRLFGRDDEA